MPLFVKAVVGLLILAVCLEAITDRTIILQNLSPLFGFSLFFLISIAGGTRFDVVISVKPGIRLDFIVSPDPAITEYGGRLKCGQYMCSDQVSDD